MEATNNKTINAITTAFPIGALAGVFLQRIEKYKERYNNKRAPKQNIGGQIFSLVIGIFAGYLSWTCNTVDGVSVPLKVFYAFFAFSFGPLYLVYYYVTRGFKVCAKV